ncbi:MAG: hypothetical protein EKK33_21240 [Bradyrhizobiaceae bacterium]|jgi:hypothetical protein|nr:MAG: hypothetical protein EKK33_21240 [Bradyrhizobiaceae bacterium]
MSSLLPPRFELSLLRFIPTLKPFEILMRNILPLEPRRLYLPSKTSLKALRCSSLALPAVFILEPSELRTMITDLVLPLLIAFPVSIRSAATRS